MQVNVQGSGVRIRLTKTEQKKLSEATNLAASLALYCPTAGNTAEALKSLAGRIEGDGTYKPREQPKV